MKRYYFILGCLIFVILIAFVAINFYTMHKTRYLNYNLDSCYGGVSRIEFTKSIRLNGYPEQAVFTDKYIINKVMSYLNSIPLVYVPRYAYPSESNGTLTFYNEDGIVVGWIMFFGEEYIKRGYDNQFLKIRDEGTLIVTGLRELELD